MSTGPSERVAIAVVTFNRADLLEQMLAGLKKLDRPADAVYVVDNASSDRTPEVLAASEVPGLHVIRCETNVGGAGGFHLATKTAYEAGYDRMWLMDDDVIPAPDSLTQLLVAGEDCMMAVREDTAGRLVEKAALRFDMRNPLAIRPKTAMVESTYGTRSAMPERVPVENVTFEGFMVHRRVIDLIGLPDPSFFIFYDDVDFALRARAAGFTIWAIRDAVLVRQLDFNQQHDLSGWKGYYMYRNLFAVHLRYGENAGVRAKPWLITAALWALAPKKGAGEARNAVRALRDSRGMR